MTEKEKIAMALQAAQEKSQELEGTSFLQIGSYTETRQCMVLPPENDRGKSRYLTFDQEGGCVVSKEAPEPESSLTICVKIQELDLTSQKYSIEKSFAALVILPITKAFQQALLQQE